MPALFLLGIFPFALGTPPDGDWSWVVWTKRPTPVHSRAGLGEIEPVAGDPAVTKDGDIYRMFYSCDPLDTEIISICEATSPDGLEWTDVPGKRGTPGLVFEGDQHSWDRSIETPFLLERDNGYLLYYAAYEEGAPPPALTNPGRIGVVRSTDTLEWERFLSDPILPRTPGSWDSNSLFSPSIIEQDGVLYMVYSGQCYFPSDCPDTTRFSYILGATSPVSDAIGWTKKADGPVIGPDDGIPDFFGGFVGEPGLDRDTDGRYYLFISAGCDAGGYSDCINLARSDQPFGPYEIYPHTLLYPSPSPYERTEIIAPSVIFENGIGRMWYHGLNTEPIEGESWGAYIMYAESHPLDLAWLRAESNVLVWNAKQGAAGYDLVRGSLLGLHADRGLEHAQPFQCAAPNSWAEDGEIPTSGDGFYYLARDTGGSWGSARRDQEIAVCQ